MGIETIVQPIKAPSVEEHERILMDKIAEIQLEYVDRLFSKKIPFFEKLKEEEVKIYSFSNLLNKYTDTLRELMKYYKIQKENEGIIWEAEMYESAELNFVNKITEFYEKDYEHWIEKTMDLLAGEREKAGKIPVKNLENTEQNNSQDSRIGTAGIISFSVEVGYGNLSKYKDLNFKKEDICMGIHLEPLYKKTLKEADTNIFSSKSLEKLALEIVDKYPEVKAIIAESWLMDTPIAKRIGFDVHNQHESSDGISNFLGGAFWGQFLNSKGQIESERVKKFLETGEPPYKIKTGIIMVEDFLKKYLPKERRGLISLKEINYDYIKEMEKSSNEFKEIFFNKSNITKEEIDNFFSKNKIMGDFIKTEQGKGLDIFLKNFVENKRDISGIKEDLKFISYIKLLESFAKEKKFNKKEVIIE